MEGRKLDFDFEASLWIFQKAGFINGWFIEKFTFWVLYSYSLHVSQFLVDAGWTFHEKVLFLYLVLSFHAYNSFSTSHSPPIISSSTARKISQTEWAVEKIATKFIQGDTLHDYLVTLYKLTTCPGCNLASAMNEYFDISTNSCANGYTHI